MKIRKILQRSDLAPWLALGLNCSSATVREAGSPAQTKDQNLNQDSDQNPTNPDQWSEVLLLHESELEKMHRRN